MRSSFAAELVGARRRGTPLVCGTLVGAVLVCGTALAGRPFFAGRDWAVLVASQSGPTLEPVAGAPWVVSGALVKMAGELVAWNTGLYQLGALCSAAIVAGALVVTLSKLGAGKFAWVIAAWLATAGGLVSLGAMPLQFSVVLSFAACLGVAVVTDAAVQRPSGRADLAVAAATLGACLIGSAGVAALAVVATELVVDEPVRAGHGRSGALVRTAPIVVWTGWVLWAKPWGRDPLTWSTGFNAVGARIADGLAQLGAGSHVIGVVVATAAGGCVLRAYRHGGLDHRWLRWLVAGLVVAVYDVVLAGGASPQRVAELEGQTVVGWIVAVTIVLAAVEAARVAPSAWPAIGRAKLTAFVGVVLISCAALALAGAARAGDRDVEPFDEIALAAVEFTPGLDSPSFAVLLGGAPVAADDYQRLAGSYGSLIDHLRRRTDMSRDDAVAMDGVVVNGLGVRLTPGECSWATADPSEVISVPAGATAVVATSADSAPVAVRRISASDPTILGSVEASQRMLIRFPADTSPVPWTLAVPGGVAAVCTRGSDLDAPAVTGA